MPENKTKATTASVTTFIDALPEDKHADAKTLIKLMREVTGEKPKLWGPSIIGFGAYHYKYPSGREGDSLLVGFSPRKPATVLYGLLGNADTDALLARLGKHTTGKGCLYIKKLSDVDLKVLSALIEDGFASARARHVG
jgi:hypothetical protein